jgi:hypothetical protein
MKATAADEITYLKCMLRKISQAKGRIQLRNARVKVFGALRRIENVIEKTYPRIEKEPKPLDMTLEGRADRLTWARFMPIVRREILDQFSSFSLIRAQFAINRQMDYAKEPARPVVEGRHGHSRGIEMLEAEIRWRPLIGHAHKSSDLYCDLFMAIVRATERDMDGPKNRAFLRMARAAQEWIPEGEQ